MNTQGIVASGLFPAASGGKPPSPVYRESASLVGFILVVRK
ncbi:MAG TPA: hypothetical protein VI636_16615 [Candidatus Angelobacter sp.]